MANPKLTDKYLCPGRLLLVNKYTLVRNSRSNSAPPRAIRLHASHCHSYVLVDLMLYRLRDSIAEQCDRHGGQGICSLQCPCCYSSQCGRAALEEFSGDDSMPAGM